MRRITTREANEWIALAKQHGFADQDGSSFQLGRFLVELADDGAVYVTIMTPLPAGLRGPDLTLKTPPIMFDRTESGEIIIPGVWWASMLEALSVKPEVSEKDRETARIVSRHVCMSDCLLPGNTDTIEINAPNEAGELTVTEALKPGTKIRINVTAA
jgi:hypothetical protein